MLDYRSVTPVTMGFPIGKSYCTCVFLQDQGTKDFSQLDILWQLLDRKPKATCMVERTSDVMCVLF